ncbi:MAG: hypothetical protein AAFP10_00790 [Pseudomonadota bacterium]
MIIKPEKREAFHQNWERFQRLAKQTGLIKSTKLWVDGFGGLLLEPLSGYKYYAMTEFENIADNEKMHRKLAEESEEYREFEQQLFEQSIPNTGKCLIMTDDFIRHI